MNRHNVTPPVCYQSKSLPLHNLLPQYHQRITCGSASQTTLCVVNQTESLKVADKTNLNCFTQRYTGPTAVLSAIVVPKYARTRTHAHAEHLREKSAVSWFTYLEYQIQVSVLFIGFVSNIAAEGQTGRNGPPSL